MNKSAESWPSVRGAKEELLPRRRKQRSSQAGSPAEAAMVRAVPFSLIFAINRSFLEETCMRMSILIR